MKLRRVAVGEEMRVELLAPQGWVGRCRSDRGTGRRRCKLRQRYHRPAGSAAIYTAAFGAGGQRPCADWRRRFARRPAVRAALRFAISCCMRHTPLMQRAGSCAGSCRVPPISSAPTRPSPGAHSPSLKPHRPMAPPADLLHGQPSDLRRRRRRHRHAGLYARPRLRARTRLRARAPAARCHRANRRGGDRRLRGAQRFLGARRAA